MPRGESAGWGRQMRKDAFRSSEAQSDYEANRMRTEMSADAEERKARERRKANRGPQDFTPEGIRVVMGTPEDAAQIDAIRDKIRRMNDEPLEAEPPHAQAA